MSKKTDSSEKEDVIVDSPQVDSPQETTIETKEDVTVSKENLVKNDLEKAVTNSLTKAKKPKRYGVERFLQLYPQSNYVAAILRKIYANEVMTAEEWLALIDSILSNKPRSVGGNKNGR